MPKGVLGHDWNTPVSKPVDIKELRPGDPEIPAVQPNGDSWPTDAGALRIKMQFNMETEDGRKAFSNCKFFENEQEWSIGYQVRPGMYTMDSKTGVRNIHDIDLFEYSPVLFGAMPMARTASFKSAA